MNEREIFDAALLIPDAESRSAYLQHACINNAPLREHIEGLLRAEQMLGSFLQVSPAAIAQGGNPTIDQPGIEPGTHIGRYKLLEQVGEGGMGVVHVAEQTEPVRRRVALKIIKPGMDTKQVIARFEAERQALAMMDHPNIARVLDAGTTETGRPYFVMELVRGMAITEYCDKARLSPCLRLELFVDVCQAVQHAHQKGIIHRDLKPSNVMVTMQDGRPVVKVIDFGVAKAVGQQLTERTVYTALTQLVGTPLYMSPEQAELTSHDVDTRSDVYSLGVLLYELLTGQTPFDKDRLKSAGFDEMRRIIREEEPETVSTRIARTRNAELGVRSAGTNPKSKIQNLKSYAELDWIVMKALEKDRSRRYESASALATDIQRYLSDEPVLACPPTTMYRFQKFARKHKPALATAAAIALCLLLGTTVSAWQAVRATTAEAQATVNEQKAVANEQRANAERDEIKALNDKLIAKEQQLQRTLYAAHMNLAQQAWEAGAIGRVDDLLNQHRPKPGDTDLRGFEWRYLHRLSHSELLTLKGLAGSIPGDSSVAFSPDGKRLASGSDNAVKVLDAATGQELLVLKGHSRYVSSVAFSPDGKSLASGSGSFGVTPGPGEVKVWDVQTGQELFTCNGHSGPVWKVAFSLDGKRLASASGDKTVRIWDAQSGQELLAFKGHAGEGDAIYSGVNSVAFSPEGNRMASAGNGGVKVWDAQTGQELPIIKYNVQTNSVTFSPDGKRLASAASDKTVRVWDAESGQELLSLKFTVQVNSVAFTPDSKRVATGTGGGQASLREVKLWDAATGQELLTFKGHTTGVSFVVFSPDGTRLASAAADGTVKIWDATLTPEPRIFRGPTDRVFSVAFSPNGKRLATLGRDNITVWDSQTGKDILTFKVRFPMARSLSFSPDGARLASGSGDKTVKVWDAQSGRDLLTFKGHTAAVMSVAFSPDGRRVASSSSLAGAIHPSDPGEPGEVKVWDALTGQELLNLKGHSRFVNSVVFSADGKRLATLGRDQAVKVWDAQTGQEILSLKASVSASGRLAFSPDGQRLAAASGWSQAELKVWDAQTGQELFTRIGGGQNLAFSPDGMRLASTANDGTVKVWDAQIGQELIALQGTGDSTYTGMVTFSPDGHRMASAGDRLVIYDATPLPEKP